MQLTCLTFALWPFHTINLQAINALGRSDLFLKLEIIKKTIGLIAIFSTIKFGVWWMIAIGAFVTGPMSVLINSWPNRKLLNYTIGMQVRDIFPCALICGGMALVMVPLYLLPLSAWAILLLQFVVGSVTFFALAILFRLRALQEYLRIGGPILQRVAKGPLKVFLNKITAYVLK